MNTRITQGCLAVFDVAPLHIGQDILKNGPPNVTVPRLLNLHHLGDSRNQLKIACPLCLKAAPKNAGVFRNHALLDIAVFKHVQNLMDCRAQKRLMLGAGLDVVPQIGLCIVFCAAMERGRLRIPFFTFQPSVIGLAGQEVGVKHMAQFMSEHPADLFIPLLPGLALGNAGMSGIEPDTVVIRLGRCPFLGFPYQFHFHPAAITITAGLGCGYILKMSGHSPGGEQLPVRDGLFLLGNQLLDFLMIHPCQEFRTSLLKSAFLSPCLLPFRCKERLQHRGNQCVPVLFIRSGLADNGTQSGGIRIAGNFRTHDPADQAPHSAASVRDSMSSMRAGNIAMRIAAPS